MNRSIRVRLFALVLCVGAAALSAPTAAAATGPECAVSAEEWSRPRSAAMVVALPGVRACVARWQQDPRQRLVLVHAASEEGALWANELRDWLIALGVPGAQLTLRAVGADAERVRLRIEAAVE